MQVISPWLMIPGWVLPGVGWCIMHNFRLCICANTCIVLCTHNVLFQKVLDQQALVPKPYAFTFHLKSFENTAIPSAELFSHFWLHLLVLCVRRKKKSPETSFGSRQKKKEINLSSDQVPQKDNTHNLTWPHQNYWSYELKPKWETNCFLKQRTLN